MNTAIDVRFEAGKSTALLRRLGRKMGIGVTLTGLCMTLGVLPAQARDRGVDIAIGVAIGSVLGAVAARTVDGNDVPTYVVPVYAAPVYVAPPPVYYVPAPVYYPPPVYYVYPSAPQPFYRGHHYRR